MIQDILLTAGYYLFEVMTYLLVANVLLGWFRPNPGNPIVRFIYGVTEPLLSPLRRFTVIGRIDFSAIAAVFMIQIILFPLYKWLILMIF